MENALGAAPVAPRTFARKATGLVRQAGALDVFIYNTNFINIAIGIAFILLWVPAGSYPGANPYLVILFTMIAVLPTTMVYGALASIMPRSGGDYVYVSRTLGPIWGLAANWNYTIWSFFYIGVPAAFLGRYGLSSLLRTIGVKTGNSSLLDIGAFFASPLGTFLAGFVLIALFTVIFIRGLNTYMRLQNVLFAIAILGMVAVVVVAMTADPAGMLTKFNAYFASITGNKDTGQVMVQALGKNAPAAGPFSLQDTVAAMTWAFTVLGFGLASAYIGGEIKGANRAQMRGMVGSVLFSAVAMLILLAAVLRVFPYDFLGAIGATNLPSDASSKINFGFTPVFTELVSILTSNWLLLVLIGVGFCLWTYAWLPIYIITTTRNMLAWAFDGLLPSRISAVDGRFHSPVIAIVVSSVLGTIFLAIYSFSPSFQAIAGFWGQVWTYILASVAAIVLPYKMKDVFDASPVRWRLAGIPVLSILGVLSVVGMLVIEYAFLIDPNSGISFGPSPSTNVAGVSIPNMVLLNVAVFLSGFVFYGIVKLIRSRQGVNLSLAFAEIPPE
jgi:amino acid transporter